MATTKHTVGSTLHAAAYKEDALPENKFRRDGFYLQTIPKWTSTMRVWRAGQKEQKDGGCLGQNF